MDHDAATDDDPGSVTVEVRDEHILLIGLNRPAKYNGITPEMLDQFTDALTRLDEDPDLWAGVLFGHGDHFTAGLDLPRFTAAMAAGGSGGGEARPSDDAGPSRVDSAQLVRPCRKPLISAVKGITYTAGIEWALGGDIVIAADDCRFSQLEPKRGIHATGGATIRFVQRAGWGNAMYHLLTSDEFDAEEAHRIGLVQEVVPAGRELDRALELAAVICEGAPLAVQATKASSRRYLDDGMAAAVAAFGPTQAELMATDDVAEGVQSFIERRPARFTGR